MSTELRPSVKTPIPGPESERLNKRGRDLLMGIGLSDGESLVPFVSRYRDERAAGVEDVTD